MVTSGRARRMLVPAVAAAATKAADIKPPGLPAGAIDSELVRVRLEEAWVTLRRMPATACFPAGLRTVWPELLGEIDLEDVDLPASARAIDAMDEAYGWLALIPADQVRERRAVLLRSMVGEVGGPAPAWRWIGEQLRIDKNTAAAHWHRGIARIVVGLQRVARAGG